MISKSLNYLRPLSHKVLTNIRSNLYEEGKTGFYINYMY